MGTSEEISVIRTRPAMVAAESVRNKIQPPRFSTHSSFWQKKNQRPGPKDEQDSLRIHLPARHRHTQSQKIPGKGASLSGLEGSSRTHPHPKAHPDLQVVPGNSGSRGAPGVAAFAGADPSRPEPLPRLHHVMHYIYMCYLSRT